MEHHSQTESNAEALPQNEHSLQEVFSKQAIETVRSRQKDVYYLVFHQSINEGKDVAEAKHTAELASNLAGHDYIDQFHDQAWMNDRQTDTYDLIDKYSFAAMSDAEWVSAERADDGSVVTKSGIDLLNDDLAAFEAEAQPPIPEADPQREALRHEVNDLRESLATLSAKRQGSLLDLNKEQYDTVRALYNEKVTELARIDLAEDLSNDNLDQTEKNALVIARYFAEQQQLRDLSKEKMASTATGKFINWFTSGTKGQRFIKAALLGAGAATVGAVAGGIIAGVAGTAAIAGGVAATATAASRFAKGYARSDARSGRGIADLSDEHAVNARTSIQSYTDADIFDVVQQSLDSQLEHDTKKEKQKRRKSVLMGVGAAAMGGALATGVAVASDFMGSGSVGEWMNRQDPFVDHVHSVIEPDAQPVVDYSPQMDGESVPDVPVTPEVPSFDPNFSIDSGEGGIAFFQSLGLNESQWYEVAGELKQNFPNEFYTEGYDVRIAQPGQLSIEAQQFIKNRFGL